MPASEGYGGDGWTEVRAIVLEQHRTLRMLAEATREIAKATLRGDELGLVVMPYLLLGLDRAVRTQFKEEESLVCPLLESDIGSGPTWASSLRTKHLHILGEVASLTTGGVQDAVTLARRLHALTSTLLDDLREQEETLWSGGGLRAGSVQLGRA
jgi:Hemerythrin HHE cation binding domain